MSEVESSLESLDGSKYAEFEFNSYDNGITIKSGNIDISDPDNRTPFNAISTGSAYDRQTSLNDMYNGVMSFCLSM